MEADFPRHGTGHSDRLHLWGAYPVVGVVSGAAGARCGAAGALFPIAGVAVLVGPEVRRLRAGAPRRSRTVA